MTVRSVRFLGIRSAAAPEMVRLCGDVLGLESGEDGTARNHYRAPDGNVYELMGRAPASAEASTHG